jgi:phosphatidylethanolamine/phosphatidyl-N-methylethanolamine N-methyltransferase
MNRTRVGSQAHESRLYYEFSQLYDMSFGRVFYPRVASVIRSLEIPEGSRVLELGVGTGLSLDAYPSHCEVTGIDLAPDMLEHAQDKIDQNGWRHIRVLPMDAMNLRFPDSSFDYVMAFHVVSVVPDVARLMAEAQRVCRADGMVVVINHFRSRNPTLAAIDRRIEPLTRWLGWHTLDRDDVFRGSCLTIERAYKTSRNSLFTIVLARNLKPEPVDELDLVRDLPRVAAGCASGV